MSHYTWYAVCTVTLVSVPNMRHGINVLAIRSHTPSPLTVRVLCWVGVSVCVCVCACFSACVCVCACFSACVCVCEVCEMPL